MILKSETMGAGKVFILQAVAEIAWACGQFADKENCMVVHRDVINLNLFMFVLPVEKC